MSERNKEIKMDLYLLKVLNSKNIDIEKVLTMSTAEIEELGLSSKIVQCIAEYKSRGAKSEDQLVRDLQQVKDSVESFVISEEVKEALEEYKVEDHEVETVVNDVVEKVQKPVLDKLETEDKVLESSEELKPSEQKEEKSETVEVKINVPKTDVVVQVKSVLQSKVLKSHASYLKLLKSELPKEVLEQTDGNTIGTLISQRLSELKEKK